MNRHQQRIQTIVLACNDLEKALEHHKQDLEVAMDILLDMIKTDKLVGCTDYLVLSHRTLALSSIAKLLYRTPLTDPGEITNLISELDAMPHMHPQFSS